MQELRSRCASVRKLPKSGSLYELGDKGVRVYARYSKLHSGNRTFYGLRQQDLRELEGRPSFVCFLWEGQREPLLVPYAEYEDVFHSTPPAGDGQYKSLVLLASDGTELYIANAGRFNVEGHFGWQSLETALASTGASADTPDLTHAQVQTLLGSIGARKGYDVWIPLSDRTGLDWSLAPQFRCRPSPLSGYDEAAAIVEEIDVLWVARGSNDLRALFEVEHSTPIYSGLLRLNDLHVAAPRLRARFTIAANAERRSLFARQVRRPTFRASGLGEICSFLEYADVYRWYERSAHLP